jgi:hypothetical protein
MKTVIRRSISFARCARQCQPRVSDILLSIRTGADKNLRMLDVRRTEGVQGKLASDIQIYHTNSLGLRRCTKGRYPVLKMLA